jgi:hypothetical protein
MSEPKFLDDLIPLLRASKPVMAACRKVFDVYTPDLLQNVEDGDTDEFFAWWEEWRQRHCKEVAHIEAAAPDGEAFVITVHQAGPLFWITAPEFSDIEYFDSLEAAEDHAQCEFEAYIDELEQRQLAADEEDDEEEDDDEDDEDDGDGDDDDGDEDDGDEDGDDAPAADAEKPGAGPVG